MRDEGVREAFEQLSADYDARFPRIIPRYQEFHVVIVQRVVEHVRGPIPPGAGGESGGGAVGTFVELGCGTGELSRRLLEALPGMRLHCIDLSPAMVERAREKLAPWGTHVTFAVGNFLSAPLPEPAAGAVSALAVHHLDAGEKRGLFGRLARTLEPDGILVLGDAVSGGSAFYTDYFTRRWVDHMCASGMDAEEVESVLRDHEQNDRFSGLDEQMTWLREAGFRDVECLWKHFLLAVIAARGSRRF